MYTAFLLVFTLAALSFVLLFGQTRRRLVLLYSAKNQLLSTKEPCLLYANSGVYARGGFFLETSEADGALYKVFSNIAKDEKHHTSTAMNKNFGLTEPEFARLLSALQKGDETIFEQVFLMHFEDCCRYLMKTYRASSEDAYDASMSTMLEFCKRLKAGRIAYGNLRFLFTRMAGQVYLKWIKKQQKQTGFDNMDLLEAPEEIDDESYVILNKAWNSLYEDCKTLLAEFYYAGATLEHIATTLNRSAVAIRKRKQRCVESLRELFIQYSSPEN